MRFCCISLLLVVLVGASAQTRTTINANQLPASVPSLTTTAAQDFAGPIKAATINGEIEVDGVTYTTVTAAINAALAFAQANNRNATVRLGPGDYAITAGTQFDMPANGACVNLLGSAGIHSTSGGQQTTRLVVSGSLPTASLSRASGTVTATLSSSLALVVGQEVYVGTSSDVTDFPIGSQVVVSVTPSSGAVTSFTYASTGSNVSATGAPIAPNLFTDGTGIHPGSCNFKDFAINANNLVNHAWELLWPYDFELEHINVNETSGDGIVVGETSPASGHNAGFTFNKIWVSWVSGASGFTPAVRPAYGIHYRATAYDSRDFSVQVRNALVAGTFDEGADNIHYLTHNFGYPFSCTTPPCNNRATTVTDPTASWAGDYSIIDAGVGNQWIALVMDSPAIAGLKFTHRLSTVIGGVYETADSVSFTNTYVGVLDNTAGTFTNALVAGLTCGNTPTSGNMWNLLGASNAGNNMVISGLSGCPSYSVEATATDLVIGSSALFGSHTFYGGVSGALAARLFIQPRTTTSVPITLQTTTTSYGDLVDAHTWNGSAGSLTPIFHLTRDGSIGSYQQRVFPSVVTASASSVTLTKASGTVTGVLSTPLMLQIGESITISASADTTNFPNGSYTLVSTLPGTGTATSFTYAASGASASTTATVTALAQIGDGNGFILASAASGNLTLVLPRCTQAMADTITRQGSIDVIQRTDAGSNTLTLATSGTDTLFSYGSTGLTTLTLPVASSTYSGQRTLRCGSTAVWYVQ